MNHDFLDSKDLSVLKSLVDNAKRIVLTCHVAPDGDALGSTLAFCQVLKAMGKNAIVVSPDRPPRSLAFLPGINDLVAASCNTYQARGLMRNADLIICLDFNALKRLDLLSGPVTSAKAPKVLIDHHLDPENFAAVTFSFPSMAATCQLLFHILDAEGWLRYLDRDGASCLYTGLMTDTGNFSYNSSNPDLYLIIASLLEKGIDKDDLYTKACNTFSESCLRLNGYALCEKMQVFAEHKAALIVLTREDLERFGYIKGDTEGLVNKPLAIPGVEYSVFIREDESMIKVSMRSKGNFPVNKLCEQYFNGGGHRNAAGGEMTLPLTDVVDIFLGSLNDNDKYLNE